MLPLAPAPPRSLLHCAPTVSLSFNNTPRLPFLSLRLLMFHFSLFLYSSCLCSLCPIGIRVGDDISVLQVHPHHHGKSYSFPSPIPFSHALLYHWMCRKQERKRMARIRRKEMMDKRRKEEKKTARWSTGKNNKWWWKWGPRWRCWWMGCPRPHQSADLCNPRFSAGFHLVFLCVSLTSLSPLPLN